MDPPPEMYDISGVLSVDGAHLGHFGHAGGRIRDPSVGVLKEDMQKRRGAKDRIRRKPKSLTKSLKSQKSQRVPVQKVEKVLKSKKAVKTNEDAHDVGDVERASTSFSIVGVGASAGGLEALGDLLAELPENPGFALVIVQHLDPSHISLTASILDRKSAFPVWEVESGMRIEANHVYVIPPNATMSIHNQVLKLSPRRDTEQPHLPIDHFFRSLAIDQGEHAIGVVLSGTASDGTHGLEAIKGAGGLTFAQEPKSARFDGMPRSAIMAGVVDLILTPPEIGRELVRIAGHPIVKGKVRPSSTAEFAQILSLLDDQCQTNFSQYRRSTIERRVLRRMVLSKHETMGEYLEHLKERPEEFKTLCSDLLINVTEFFRDAKVFAGLKNQVFAKVLKEKKPSHPIRIWVVGCSTGEEVYSVAISLLEYAQELDLKLSWQIFGTDISEPALRKARLGEYPGTIAKSVSKDRLQKFFLRTDHGYKVGKYVREHCVFSRHDVTRDPPFAKLDLICCRNLLIYFEPPLQKRVLSIFHYSLTPTGMLWLGRSESAGHPRNLFQVLDKAKKFYAPRPARIDPQTFPTTQYPFEATEARRRIVGRNLEQGDIQAEADQRALIEYAPPAVIVNSDMQIVSTRGDITPYFQLPAGQASLSIFRMARPEMLNDLRMVLQSARKKASVVAKRSLSLAGGKNIYVFIKVIPLVFGPARKEHFFQVCIEQLTKAENQERPVKGSRSPYVKELERKLAEAKSYQESLILDFEAVQEELTSANEEMQSANEEFQSTNEELETAKEELQSTNEELTTINDELAARNIELDRTNNDLNNFFSSVEIPVVMVGLGGDIRRFTPRAAKLMKLIPGDIGRPIGDIKSVFGDAKLPNMITEAIESVSIQEIEVLDPSGPWYRIQVRPYKTSENKIDGAVVSLIDIDYLKRSLLKATSELEYAMGVADSVQLPLAVIDKEFKILSVNRAFSEKYSPNSVAVGRDLTTIFQESGHDLQRALDSCLKNRTTVQGLKIEAEIFELGLGPRSLQFGARTLPFADDDSGRLLVSIEDTTHRELIARERAILLESERVARLEAERAVASKDIFLSSLSHELRTPLNAILSWAQLLQKAKGEIERRDQGLKTIEVNAKVLAQLVDDLLDVARIKSGKLSIFPKKIPAASPILAAIDSVSPLAKKKNVAIEFQDKAKTRRILADPMRLQQVVWNLLTNAIKFSEAGQTVQVVIAPQEPDSKYLVIQVIDHGRGMDPKFVPFAFQQFTQADGTSTRRDGGLGLGLSITSELLRLQGGAISAESEGLGKGSTFTALIPLVAATGEDQSSQGTDEEKVVEEKDAHKSRDEMNLDGICVLIVDDSFDSLEVLDYTLKHYGAEVVAFGTVAEALKSLDERQPQILISDIAMPGQDGYAFIQQVRQRSSSQGGKIPAIALSAYVSEEDVKRSIEAGFQKHLTKPFDAEVLCQSIRSLVSRQ